jgi:uncharacterized protein
MHENTTALNRKALLRRILRLLLFYGGGTYLLVCLIVGACQRRILYRAPRLTGERVDALALKAGIVRWRDASGATIGLKRLSPRRPTAGQVMIAYGQGSIAAECAPYADEIQNIAALDIFILEYPGYADRLGSPTENTLCRAADEALQLLDKNQPVYLLGASLGSGVAAYLAGKYPDRISGMILLSPYDRLSNVAHYRAPFLPVRLLLIDRFPSADYLSNYHGPVGVMVDGRDHVVPERFGRQLYNSYAGPKRLWEYPNGSHLSIMEPPEIFWRKALDFLQTNQSAGS